MLVYSGRNKAVQEATAQANLLLQNHAKFMDRIAEEEYTMTEVDASDISSFMAERFINDVQYVKTWRPWWRWYGGYAYFSYKRPKNINLNSRKLRRYPCHKENVDSITGSIIHEYVHLVDNFYKEARFGHGDNKGPQSFEEGSEMWRIKYHSTPYKIGRLAKVFCGKTLG